MWAERTVVDYFHLQRFHCRYILWSYEGRSIPYWPFSDTLAYTRNEQTLGRTPKFCRNEDIFDRDVKSFSIIIWVIVIAFKTVYRLSQTEQRASDNSEVHRQHQNCGSWVRKILRHTAKLRCFLRFFERFWGGGRGVFAFAFIKLLPLSCDHSSHFLSRFSLRPLTLLLPDACVLHSLLFYIFL